MVGVKQRMPVMSLKYATTALATGSALMLSACGATSTPTDTALKRTSERIDITQPLLLPEVREKLPISVGVYYAPEFVNYRGIPPPSGSRTSSAWDVPLGAVTAQFFDQASRALFAKVIPVSGLPPFRDNLSIDGVIVPAIEAFDMQHSALLGGDKLKMGGLTEAYPVVARVRYRFLLFDRSGASITSWVVIGDAAMLMPFGFPPDLITVLVDAATQDAMRQFVQGFGRNPDIVHWISRKASP
jgi:hypothetical protein